MQSWAVASSRCWSRFGAAGGDRFRGIRYARPGTPILHSKIQAIRDEREYAAADSAEPRRPRYAASRLLTANSQGSWARPMLAWLASSSGAPTSSSAARAETSAKWRFCPNQVFRATSRQLRKLALPSRFTLFETASKTRLTRALHTGVPSHGFCTRDFSASSTDSESRERFGLWKGSLSKILPHLVRIYFTSAAARLSFSGVVS
jgi:hypothetical protein